MFCRTLRRCCSSGFEEAIRDQRPWRAKMERPARLCAWLELCVFGGVCTRRQMRDEKN